MTLLAILGATLAAGIGSVWLAAALLRLSGQGGVGASGPGPQYLLSLAAGALLATALMHLLPEAFESGIEPARLLTVLLFGLVFFFLLDKAQLWHHGHEHHPGHADHGDHHAGHHFTQVPVAAHGHAHGLPAAGPDPHRPLAGSWSLLTGDSVHCFGDGVLIASAFMADLRLGAVTALAVLAHEVPHHVGDLLVLRHGSASARAALLKVSLAGTVTALGGLAGWWLVAQRQGLLPYFLVLAASSFVYVALADLIPQLQRRMGGREALAQILWLLAGIALVAVVSRLAHGAGGHMHEPAHEGAHKHAQARPLPTLSAEPSPATAGQALRSWARGRAGAGGAVAATVAHPTRHVPSVHGA